jgi:hypothetical protein
MSSRSTAAMRSRILEDGASRSRRGADDGGSGLDVIDHDRVRADASAVADRDVAKDGCPRAHDNVVPQDRDAGTGRVLPDGHVLEERATVTDDGSGVHDDAEWVRQEEVGAEALTAKVTSEEQGEHLAPEMIRSASKP